MYPITDAERKALADYCDRVLKQLEIHKVRPELAAKHMHDCCALYLKGMQGGLTVEQMALTAIANGVADRSATCIGCGCTDEQRCMIGTHYRRCHWLRVDRDADIGVCSCCSSLVADWDAGVREREQR